MTNRFSLRRYRVVWDPPDDEVFPDELDVAVPVIDGVPLYERLAAERFPGLAVAAVSPPSQQWLGRPEEVEHGRAVVLDGECLHAGCCGVVADIAVGPVTVVWSDLYGHGSPTLEPGLRFEFDRAEYEAAITGLSDLEPVEHRIVDDELPL